MNKEQESESAKALKVLEHSDAIEVESFNFAIFYSFARKVLNGDAKPNEIAFMSKVFDLITKRNDWNVALTSDFSER